MGRQVPVTDVGHEAAREPRGRIPWLGSALAPTHRPHSAGLVSVGSWGRVCLQPLPSPCSVLDPSLVAFLKSHSCTREQAEEKATREQRPGRPSAEVIGKEAIAPTSASVPRQENELEPETPGLEEEGTLEE